LFPNSLSNLLELGYYCKLELEGSFLTLDSGFDSKVNKANILDAKLTPVIKPNIRGLKDRERFYEKLNDFEKLKDIYNERYKVERCFAWEDSYRRLVTRYDKLQSTFNGFRNLAYSMINFRNIFN
jgi:hypothetical protein